jgi:hypothetical protein
MGRASVFQCLASNDELAVIIAYSYDYKKIGIKRMLDECAISDDYQVLMVDILII